MFGKSDSITRFLIASLKMNQKKDNQILYLKAKAKGAAGLPHLSNQKPKTKY